MNPPGVADQTATTNEDTAATVIVNVATPNDNPLTYIITQPAHGTLSGSGPDFTYTPAPNFNGSDSFTFSVNNASSSSNTATFSINVRPVNDAPVLTSVPVSGTTNEQTAYTFTAQATDVDGDTLSFSLNGSPAGAMINSTTGAFTWTPTSTQAGATYVFDVVVSDGVASASSATSVTVFDTTAPAISNLVLSLTELWPANHKMIDVSVAYSAADLIDAAPTCSLSVTSNEPVNGVGDGNTAPDWEVVDTHHVRLRAERSGGGSGRVYTIAADCRDRFGNAAQSFANVTVPLSQGKNK